MRDNYPPSLPPPQIMSKRLKYIKSEVYGKYTLRGYQGKTKFFVVVTVTDKGGNYLQIKRVKPKHSRSMTSAFNETKRLLEGSSPPTSLTIGLEAHSYYSFEFWRLRNAEKSHFDGMDWFYFNGFTSYNWPHLLIQDKYYPSPSALDMLDDEDDYSDEKDPDILPSVLED